MTPNILSLLYAFALVFFFSSLLLLSRITSVSDREFNFLFSVKLPRLSLPSSFLVMSHRLELTIDQCSMRKHKQPSKVPPDFMN